MCLRQLANVLPKDNNMRLIFQYTFSVLALTFYGGQV